MKLFELAGLILHSDIPSVSWLREKQKWCKEDGMNSFGAPNFWGSITGTWNRNVLIPVATLSKLRGRRDEHNRTREDDLANLIKIMGETNSLPKLINGKIYAPYIEVWYDGQIWINEGNHRIKAAHQLGWDYLPVTVRYFSGGEEADGILSPEKVKLFDAKAISFGFDPEEFIGTL